MRRIRLLAMLGSLGVAAGAFAERLRRHPAFEHDARARGRHARSPFEMTWLGWKDIGHRTFQEALDDRLLSVAAGVAFFALMALVPGLSVLVSLYGLITDPATIDQQLAPLFGLLPDSASMLIQEQAHRLATESSRTLSFNLLVSLAIAGWSANAGVKSLFDALNVIYEETEKRSFITLNVVSLLATISAVLVVILAVFFITVAPALIARAPLSSTVEFVFHILRWPVFFGFATLIIATLYWIGPSRRPARFIWVTPGALLSALLWAAVSAGFSFYVSTLGNYQATYGSLSAVIVFMTWLWLSASVILLGAELNSELEHQTARDTTLGAPKPRGARGATMADKIGPPRSGT